MRSLKQLLLTACLAVLPATFAATADAQQRQEPPPPPSRQSEAVPQGWQRYELEGGGGGSLSALFPEKPQDFGAADLRRPSGGPLTIRVHMLAADSKVYAAVFVDLPKEAAEMSDEEKGEVFYGGWRALAAQTSAVLEKKFGAPFPVTSSAQKSRRIPVGEQRMQDFKVGTQNGRAQAMLIGRRGYLVAAVWDGRPESEKDAMRFLNSFQVKPSGVGVGGRK
ncbi:MAG TPA: hypothetical protein VF588_09555 [Pyrinomonadaceae bacterium]|jgi:cytochrome c556